MRQDLLALITSEDNRSLTALARALARVERRDHLPVWRQFFVRLAYVPN